MAYEWLTRKVHTLTFSHYYFKLNLEFILSSSLGKSSPLPYDYQSYLCCLYVRPWSISVVITVFTKCHILAHLSSGNSEVHVQYPDPRCGSHTAKVSPQWQAIVYSRRNHTTMSLCRFIFIICCFYCRSAFLIWCTLNISILFSQ